MATIDLSSKNANVTASVWDRKLVRLGLFIGAGIVALLFLVFTRGPVAILFSCLFPVGLFAWLARPPNVWDWEPWIVPGYLAYLAVMIPGVVVRSRRIFKILFVVFVILLMANVGGCQYYLEHYIDTIDL